MVNPWYGGDVPYLGVYVEALGSELERQLATDEKVHTGYMH